jgi:hypothetical protein
MSNKYLNEEDENLTQEINNNAKYSKKFLLGGIIGLSLTALSYYLSNEVGLNTFNKALTEMDTNELLHTAIFGISFFSTFGGGLMYGMSNFAKKDFELVLKKKKEDLEKKLNDKSS